MTLFSLEDQRWAELRSGYRLVYDARPLLQRFATGDDLASCWDEVWNELHHQGDVDTCSYAVLPHLISIFHDRSRDWNLYSFAGIVAVEAGEEKNPIVPDYLRSSFREALDRLFELALSDMKSEIPLVNVRAILSFMACHKGAEALSRAIADIDLFDMYGEQITEAESNGQ